MRRVRGLHAVGLDFQQAGKHQTAFGLAGGGHSRSQFRQGAGQNIGQDQIKGATGSGFDAAAKPST